MKLTRAIPLFFFFVVFATTVFADARSDYDYQYTKYREHYSEFLLFKKDYLTNPTLDNQQKALLLAKLSMNTRDLTYASFAAYLRSLIASNNLQYDPINPISASLITAQQFFLTESSKSQSIVTLQDMDTFDTDYIKAYPEHEKSLKAGIVAAKIAKFKNLSLQQDQALKKLKQKLADNVSVRVTERIDQLDKDLLVITEKIDNMANFLISKEGMDNADSEIFFSAKIELLSDIRTLQLKWMDQLIDLDLNYGKI